MDPRKACLANCELFGKFASYFESQVVPLWGEVYDSLVARSGVKAGEKVLDVGTGTGEVALRVGKLVGNHGHVLGVDSVEEMIEIAGRKAESRGFSNVRFKQMSVEELGLPDSSFDSVVGNYSLCCCFDYEAALAECLRVLEPRGRLTYNHSGPGDALESQLAFKLLEKYKTKAPSKRLVEIRGADAVQKEAVEKFRDPMVTLAEMRALGYENAEATMTRRVIRYKDADAFVERLLGFNWRNEADEMSPSDLRRFRKETGDALRSLQVGPKFEVADEMVFFTGLKR